MVLRGNSGSDGSTLTRALRHRFVKGQCFLLVQNSIPHTVREKPTLRTRSSPR